MSRINLFDNTRRGVAFWVPITVFLAIVGLVVALLPTMTTSASAAEESDVVETVVETSPVSNEATSLEISLAEEPFVYYADEETTSDDSADATDETAVEDTEETSSVTEPETEDSENLDEPSLADKLLSALNFGPMAALQIESEIVDIQPADGVGPIRISDNIAIYGEWRSPQDVDVNIGDTFAIELPDYVKVIQSDFDLIDENDDSWGTCVANADENRYDCTIAFKPAEKFGGYGTWQGSAIAFAENDEWEFDPAGDGTFEKGGELNRFGPEAYGLVINWKAVYTNDALPTFTAGQDLVFTDSFSDNMKFCVANEDAKIPGTTVNARSGGFSDIVYPDATIEDLGGNTMEIRVPYPASGFISNKVELRYNLCTESGGMDPKGTEYFNNITDGSGSGSDTVVQELETSGTATATPYGSFTLQKLIDPVAPGAENIDFVVRVEEFAPGNFPDGPVETTYDVTVNSNGTEVTGHNPRPAGWTIRLTELRDQNPNLPDYGWGDATFTGVDSSDIDENGNPWGAFVTNLNTNVAIQLTNKPESLAPAIGTTAQVTGSQDNVLPLTGGEVVDTVAYKNLQPETEYVLDGEIVDSEGNSTGIVDSTTFTTPAAAAGQTLVSGTAEVTFTITGAQAEQYAGQDLVVFETLYLATDLNTVVAEHKDVDDVAQTFTVERTPEIGTKAVVTGHDDNILPLTGGEVVDTVSYTDLRPETEYVLNGEIMHVNDEGDVAATGIEGTATFTTPAAAAGETYVSGTAEVAFTITGAQAEQYAGEKLVVFEDLFLVDVKIADHRDPTDEDQTFWVDRTPEIGTKVLVTGNPDKVLALTGGTVIDTVSYTDLRPSTEYRVTGELMHVNAAGDVIATGILGETIFTTPAAAAGENYVSGTTEVTFTITAAQAEQYAGENLVVFEDLFLLDVKIADHRDPTDEDQTFEVQPPTTVVFEKEVTGIKGGDVTNDSNAEFQIKAEWTDQMGVAQERIFTVKPGVPFALDNMPLNTEIKLTEIGAKTDVSNIKWGDIIWSGNGVDDETGASASGTLIITEPGSTNVNLENKTTSNGLIIIPIPIPGIDFGGSSDKPTPDEVVEAATPTPDAPQPVEQVSPKTPTKQIEQAQPAQPKGKGLASTGANVAWLAGGAILLLLIGAGLVLRSRKN